MLFSVTSFQFALALFSYSVRGVALDSSADALISKGLEALGGEIALSKLRGVTYHSPNLYRSRSLMQSYSLNHADTSIAIAGGQNVSFSFDANGTNLMQRIDRSYIPSEYWIWGSPHLNTFNFSIVVQGGEAGFACFVQGNDQIWYPPAYTTGYTDAGLAEYLVLHGEMFSPKLLLRIKEHGKSSLTMAEFKGGVQMPAVVDHALNLTVIFNSTSNLPYIVRTIENHAIYGPSTSDLVLSDYTTVSGIQFPRHIQTIYNTSQNLNAPLEEFFVQNVTLNPQFQSSFFDGLLANESDSPKVAPHTLPGLDHWRISEWSSNMLWGGGYEKDIVRVDAPIPGLPNVYWVVVDDDSLGVRQLVIEFEDHVIVGDAPPQGSKSVIEWVAQKLNKPITHLWPTHHHRDHTGGAPMYTEIGAKLIVPEVSMSYWSSIPNATLVTFNETHPYIHKTSSLQAWFIWEAQAAHAMDFTYTVITFACPNSTSPVATFQADIWHPAAGNDRTSMQEARQWLDQTNSAGLTADTIVLPAHGAVAPLGDLVKLTAYPYPNYTTLDWMGGRFRNDC